MPHRVTLAYALSTRRNYRHKTTPRSVADKRRPATYPRRWAAAYRMRMGDAFTPAEDWAGYLKRMTKRPGWSVARLARESGIHRATIFKWMSGDRGVTVTSVRTIAAALGDELENALRAAGGAVEAPGDGERDEELELIMRAPVDAQLKARMVEMLLKRREREREQRIADFQALLEEAARARGDA